VTDRRVYEEDEDL